MTLHELPICLERRRFALALAAAAAGLPLAARASAATRDLAQRAYIWGYPSVDLYAILRAQALDRASPEFKAPLNAIGHARTWPRRRTVR